MNTIDNNTSLFESLGLSSSTPTEGKEDFGQQDFMELMLAQLNNQDPMEPMENGEFLTQIAQFNTASGISELKDSFGMLASSLHSNQALQASTLIGRSVLVESNRGDLPQNGSLTGVAELPASTQSLHINIMGYDGQLIKTIDLGQQASGEVSFSWDGTSDAGVRMPPGNYQISAEAEIDGQFQAVTSLISANVESVTLGQGGQEPTLNLSGMGSMDFSQVRQVM